MSDGKASSAAEQVTPSGSLTDLAEEYRRTRAEVESSILPLATSVDGRQFTFQVSLHGLRLQPGGYVVLEGDEERRFGQILSMRPDSESAPDLGLDTMRSSMLIRFARGEGVILEGDLQPFHDAVVRPAASGDVDSWLQRVQPNRSALTIGELLLAPGVAATLDAGASTDIALCAVNPDPARPTRSGSCLSAS